MTNRKKYVILGSGYKKRGSSPERKKDMFVAKFNRYFDINIKTALPKSVGQGLCLARTYKMSELQCIDRWRQL